MNKKEGYSMDLEKIMVGYIRDTLGETVLFESVRDYVDRDLGRSATDEEIVQAQRYVKKSMKALEDLFEEWLDELTETC